MRNRDEEQRQKRIRVKMCQTSHRGALFVEFVSAKMTRRRSRQLMEVTGLVGVHSLPMVRTKVGRNTRVLESDKTLFGQTVSENINVISMQRWDVAPNVYRFTLSQPLPPGEYVLAEVLEEGLNLYVWDFGLDAAVANGGKQAEKK